MTAHELARILLAGPDLPVKMVTEVGRFVSDVVEVVSTERMPTVDLDGRHLVG